MINNMLRLAISQSKIIRQSSKIIRNWKRMDNNQFAFCAFNKAKFLKEL